MHCIVFSQCWQGVIAIVGQGISVLSLLSKDASVSSWLNWQGISVLSLLSKTKMSVIAIELARYQCVIAVVTRSVCYRD